MQSIAAYFDVEDASELKWAHRVNTLEKLATAIGDEDVQVVEADIQFGAGDATPLVADRDAVAELDVAEFIHAMDLAGKGFKLDFHSAAAVEPTLAILRMRKPGVPVILHAEIFTLLASHMPGEGMEPDEFIRLCQMSCPKAVLSLGWSLKRTHDADGRVEEALIQQVAIMLMQRLGPVNYGLEIRAGYTPGAFGGKAEHGGALIFDPLPGLPAPEANLGDNVVHLVTRARQVA